MLYDTYDFDSRTTPNEPRKTFDAIYEDDLWDTVSVEDYDDGVFNQQEWVTLSECMCFRCIATKNFYQVDCDNFVALIYILYDVKFRNNAAM